MQKNKHNNINKRTHKALVTNQITFKSLLVKKTITVAMSKLSLHNKLFFNNIITTS